MRIRLSLFVLIFVSSFSFAEQLKQVFNPFTGKQDYITKFDSTTLLAGSGISISCVNGVCTITNTGGGGGSSFILMEDSSDVLAEDGSKLLTE